MRNHDFFKGAGLIGPKRVHEDLFFMDHCFGALNSLFFFKFLVEEKSYSLDLDMFL